MQGVWTGVFRRTGGEAMHYPPALPSALFLVCAPLAFRAVPVEGLPIVIACRLIGDPGLEIRMGALRVIVLVILAVIPVVLRVPNAVRGPPLIVDMDVVVLLAVERLLMVFRIVLVAPIILRGPRIAVIPGAIPFAVTEVSIGVVVLGVLTALIRGCYEPVRRMPAACW